MNEFYQTLMGRKFYEADVPRIVKALERIVIALEKQEITEEMKQMEASIDPEWENDVRRGR